MRGREVEVGQRVGLGLLEHAGRARAEALEHLDGDVVHGRRRRGVGGPEHRRQYPADAPAGLPGAGLAHAVAHEVHDAALPGGALEDLADRAHQARVGVGDHEPHAGHAARPHRAQEAQPRVVGLGVHHGHAKHAPPAALVAADGGDHGRGGHAALAAALHVGGVEPHVGHLAAGERPAHELVDVGVQARGDGADLVLAEPGDAHPLGDAGDLSGAGAGGVHLGHGRGQRPVDALVALYHVLGEEAARPELGHPERQVADAGLEPALAVAVAAVAARLAQLVGLGVHDAVGHLLGEAPDELLHVDRAVLEPRQRALRGQPLCYPLHCGPRFS